MKKFLFIAITTISLNAIAQESSASYQCASKGCLIKCETKEKHWEVMIQNIEYLRVNHLQGGSTEYIADLGSRDNEILITKGNVRFCKVFNWTKVLK